LNSQRVLINGGFFISPDGIFVPLKGTHIVTVVTRPKIFGLTLKEIDAAYAAHKEPTYIEGIAREEVLRTVLKKGWIRLRRHRNRWSVQADYLDERTLLLSRSWAKQILRGLGGYVERDRYFDVLLEGLSDMRQQQVTVGELAKELKSVEQIKLSYRTIEEYKETRRDD
jgi:hypothetical protein